MKQFLKHLARSGSVGFARDRSAAVDGTERTLAHHGRTLHYRVGTSDHHVIYEVLLMGKRSAYASRHLPPRRPGMTIVDVGANIGASAVFFKHRYPEARLLAFEPVPSNFAMLQKNTAGLPGVSLHNEALGESDGQLELIQSAFAQNEGGWGVSQPASEVTGKERRIKVPLHRAGSRLAALGVERIDILKLDTEGSESAIIAGLGELLGRTGYIAGELHGSRDFALLDRLEQAGFDIETKKTLGKRLFLFIARRKK